MTASVDVQKEGERILAATRRPDGTLRKPVRIRAGYTPQDEVAIYQSKAALMKQGKPVVPPGYDPDDASKPKTKAAKKNEKRKEKKQQATTSSGNNDPSLNNGGDGCVREDKLMTGQSQSKTEDMAHVVQQLNALNLSTPAADAPLEDTAGKIDLDKRIRALRKKIRTTESLQASSSGKTTLTPEQMEKLSKLDTWRKELLDMEAQYAA
ncbi:partner of Y14 and mago [Marchantia polymorpha subsp. ruderalis]